MLSYQRLLELAGRTLVLEAMTPTEAKKIFMFHGATEADLASPAALKAARIKLIRANDPNQPGADQTAAQEINAAYDTLKDGGATRPSSGGGNRGTSRPESNADQNRGNDFHDIRFFQDRMQEMAARYPGNASYTLWTFDGAFFRSVATVRGAPQMFQDMAKAMLIWGDDYFKKRAIFAIKDGENDLQLIYLDGKFLDGKIRLEHESFNQNPGNDPRFVRELPRILDRIAKTGSPDRDDTAQNFTNARYFMKYFTDHAGEKASTYQLIGMNGEYGREFFMQVPGNPELFKEMGPAVVEYMADHDNFDVKAVIASRLGVYQLIWLDGKPFEGSAKIKVKDARLAYPPFMKRIAKWIDKARGNTDAE